MKKSSIIFLLASIIVCSIFNVQSPISANNTFAINGNTLSENKGYEQNVAANYDENKTTIKETNEIIEDIVISELNKIPQNNNSISFDIPSIKLEENIALNIAGDTDYIIILPEVPQETPEIYIKPESQPTEPQIYFKEVDETVYVTDSVNVRIGPSTQHKRIGSLKYGESLKRIGIGDNGWSKVIYKGEEAFVFSDYLSKNNPKKPSSHKSNILESFDKNAENIIAMGEFKLTAYCPCYECSDNYGNNTATGTKAKENYTIAVDPKVIPYGKTVVIELNGKFYKYKAEDCGGSIKQNRIDIYYESHSVATNFGIKYANVYLIEE